MPTVFDSHQAKKQPDPQASHRPVRHHRSRMGLFTTYAQRPDGVRFETQTDKEEVVLFVRQHMIVNLGWVLLTVIMALAPSIFFPLVLGRVDIPFQIPVGYIIVVTLFWYVATFGFALASFLTWYFNIYIVTNQRVVDIDFQYLLYKHFSEAELTKIQDISYTSGGLPSIVFDYGNVFVQTAAEVPNLEFLNVPHPDRVVKTIRELLDAIA